MALRETFGGLEIRIAQPHLLRVGTTEYFKRAQPPAVGVFGVWSLLQA